MTLLYEGIVGKIMKAQTVEIKLDTLGTDNAKTAASEIRRVLANGRRTRQIDPAELDLVILEGLEVIEEAK
jgi:hypothetical protein